MEDSHNLLNMKLNVLENNSSFNIVEVVTSRFSNSSDDFGNLGDMFFDVYFSVPRFATETTLAVTSFLVNLAVLVAIHRTKTHRTGTVYNALFVNLVIANVLTCILSWLCNNLLVLFELPLLKMVFYEGRMCTVFVYLMAGTFLSAAFGIVISLTMLGFAIVQYLAICKPLEHLHLVRKSRLVCFITLSWFISLMCAITPFVIMIIISERSECTEQLLGNIFRIVTIGNNVSIALVATIYIIIVVLCCRIYVEVKLLQRRLSHFRFDQDVNYEKKAFITTVILLATLTFFFLPYTVIYITSVNQSQGSNIQPNTPLIYYMMLLPYFKYLLDPIIYGARMREVREACFRISMRCGFKGCICLVRDFVPSTAPVGTCSIQLRNIPSYPPVPLLKAHINEL